MRLKPTRIVPELMLYNVRLSLSKFSPNKVVTALLDTEAIELNPFLAPPNTDNIGTPFY